MGIEKDPTMQRHDRAFMPVVTIPDDEDFEELEDLEPTPKADPTSQRHDRAFMPTVVIPDDFDDDDDE